MSQAEKTTDLKEIARQLSDSYYKILQHSTLNEQTIQECLNLLSKYSNDLPISWFTHDFLDGLFILQKKYAKNGTSPIVVLLSGWLRRNSEADEIREDLALDILHRALLEYNDDLALQKEAWIGWVAMIGKGNRDMKLLEGMTSVIEICSQDAIKADYMAESIDAGVAHALAHTNTMNDFEIDHCQKLLRVHTNLVSKKGFHGLCSLMTAAEHVVDVRSREEPQTRVEADLSTFVQLMFDIKDDYARLAFLAGTLRTLQFSLIKMTKKLIKLRQEIEKEFIHQLNIALDSNDTMTHQDSLSYFAARCLIQMPVEQLESISNAQLLKVLTSSLLTSPFTFHHGEPFSRLENTKEMVDQLNALSEQSLFREVGRMSRTIAKLVELLINEKKEQFIVQHVLDRLLGFSYNVFIDWDQFIAKYSSKMMTPGRVA
ncbi:hypothetical protein G6F46_005726 [Rhizopus delemar]|uniref:Uncharacterized protein n=1 Tax=Rhizopus delemar TaxID=936053 RepID=A0A9P6Z500_9FUNG|nr:hypothetical protein G6F55_001477 [Rhizopus delemar]KAG1627933.1 hypothetical protein G6F45_007290 [Rhizopus arrhizus]KAG1498540.1 hypothetical protein G6F54_005015 [Rhizopus delemar]KAG1512297.1 hypothetical protein G6F53_005287 [Rhizopus delemar]KAG1525268.1 hypothetical protein G6F52_003481 [Rhizopus delemar]